MGMGRGATILLSWYHRWCNKCLCQTQTQKTLRRKHFSLHRIDQLFSVHSFDTSRKKSNSQKTPISFSLHLVLLRFKSHYGRKLLKGLTRFRCCCCCWSRPVANDYPEGSGLWDDHPKWQASCKWSSGVAGLLQMIIRRDKPLANHHLEWPASSKWSFRGACLLQMIIRKNQPLVNDHPERGATCKWSSVTPIKLVISDPDSISRTFLEQFVLVRCASIS